jgi:hypothetical protein
MSLDVSPQSEAILREEAEQEGVSIDELIRRTFGKAKFTRQIATANPEKERVFALMHKWQREYGMPVRSNGKPHRALAELSAQWEAEDANLTDSEREAERQYWEERERQYENRPHIQI